MIGRGDATETGRPRRAGPASDRVGSVRWASWFGVAICLLLALVIYSPSVTRAFEFDDIIVIATVVLKYPAWWMLMGHHYVQAGGAGGSWRPLFDIAMWIEWHTFGPFAPAYHSINALIHGTAAAFLGILAYTLGGRNVWMGAFAAGLLLVQPFPEGVAWITGGLLNALSAAFYLGGVCAFVQFRLVARHGPAFAALALVALCFSLLTYETALVAPLTIASYDILFHWESWDWRLRIRRTGVAMALTAIIGAVFVAVRAHLIGHLVGSYGQNVVLGYGHLANRLGGIARTLVIPLNGSMTRALHATPTPWPELYWLGLAATAALALFNRARVRPILFAGVLAVVSLVPFAGFIAVPEDLVSSRYLYLTVAWLVLAIAGTLRPTRVRWPHALAIFACLWIGSLGLLLFNERPWAVGGAMVADVIDAAAGRPIQVYGVPVHDYHGAYTFGFADYNLPLYPGNHGTDVVFGGPMQPGRTQFYWNGARLEPLPTGTLIMWSGDELDRWGWISAVTRTVTQHTLTITSDSPDPAALSPTLNLTGPRARIVVLAMDTADNSCQTGQVIWQTSHATFLTYFDTVPGAHQYVVLAPDAMGAETVVQLRLDALLCSGHVMIDRVSVGGVDR